jgi:hypothetical protein
MEYLMTYGWSILIVAVVLGALSFLGVFNPMTFTPKATAGGCQVIKNTELGVSNLVGSCNNQVPQYVAKFDNSIITMSNTGLESQNFTVAFWFSELKYPPGYQYPSVGISRFENSSNILWGHSFQLPTVIDNETWLGVGNGTSSGDLWIAGTGQPLNTWTFASGTFNGVEYELYLNGNLNAWSIPVTSSFVGINYIDTTPMIGGNNATDNPTPGTFEIADVQFYNTSLSQNAIAALYQEGIGGVPIDSRNLVGWWPLNGNANDYSGNQNNGVETNITFTSNWYMGYSQP